MRRITFFSTVVAAGLLLTGPALAVHGPFSASPEDAATNGIGRPPAGPNGGPTGTADPSLADPGDVGPAASEAATGGAVIDGDNHNVIEAVFPGQTPGLHPGRGND